MDTLPKLFCVGISSIINKKMILSLLHAFVVFIGIPYVTANVCPEGTWLGVGATGQPNNCNDCPQFNAFSVHQLSVIRNCSPTESTLIKCSEVAYFDRYSPLFPCTKCTTSCCEAGRSEGCCTSKDECVMTEGESKYCRPCSEKVTTTQQPRYIHTEDHDPTIDVTMEPSVHDEQPVTNESGSKTSIIFVLVIISIPIIYFLKLLFRKSHCMRAPPMSSYA